MLEGFKYQKTYSKNILGVINGIIFYYSGIRQNRRVHLPRYLSERRILCTRCVWKASPNEALNMKFFVPTKSVYNLTITFINAHKRSVVEGFLHFLARLCRSSNSHKPKKIRIRLMWKTSPVNWMKRRIWYYFYSIPLQTCLSRSIAKVLQPRASGFFTLCIYSE